MASLVTGCPFVLLSWTNSCISTSGCLPLRGPVNFFLLVLVANFANFCCFHKRTLLCYIELPSRLLVTIFFSINNYFTLESSIIRCSSLFTLHFATTYRNLNCTTTTTTTTQKYANQNRERSLHIVAQETIKLNVIQVCT